MDPITLITTAVVLGASSALKETASQVVKDSYAALKGIIVKAFGRESNLTKTVEVVEMDPDSERLRKRLTEVLIAVNAGMSAELVEAANRLLNQGQEQGEYAAEYVNQIQGDVQGWVQGDYANVTMTFGDSNQSKDEPTKQ